MARYSAVYRQNRPWQEPCSRDWNLEPMSNQRTATQTPRTFPNILSVDVEDYFQVEAFSALVSRNSWDTFPCRVVDNTRRVLDLFDECNVRGTFFLLGWVADKYPSLVREIVVRGHEAGCHSYWHRMVDQITPREFRADTERAKACIEDAAGIRVEGFRAPTFSITRKTQWAPEILIELGFSYDSSIFPIRHDRYGVPDAPRTPFVMRTPAGYITEFPLTTFRLGRFVNLPVGGGGYLRLFPFIYTRLGVKSALRQNVPITIYFHPWELDSEQPRIDTKIPTRIRHYSNLSRMGSRVQRLLSQADFVPYRDFRACGNLPEIDSARLLG